MRSILKQLCPPLLVNLFRSTFNGRGQSANWKMYKPEDASKQELDVYWTEDMAHQLETWGLTNTWIEIECLLVNCKGKVLDIACGIGVNILAMKRFSHLDIYGFDISDFLIKKAIERGVDKSKVKVLDATRTDYVDNEFDYSYSIGSLEHFTEEGIDAFLKECSRYTSKASFHMVPISSKDIDEGWIRTNQSYHNNSTAWWLNYYNKYFSKVHVIRSSWEEKGISAGAWFVCIK